MTTEKRPQHTKGLEKGQGERNAKATQVDLFLLFRLRIAYWPLTVRCCMRLVC